MTTRIIYSRIVVTMLCQVLKEYRMELNRRHALSAKGEYRLPKPQISGLETYTMCANTRYLREFNLQSMTLQETMLGEEEELEPDEAV